MKNEYNQEQIDFLKSLEYLSGGEIKDLIKGFTDLEILLTPEDLEKFNEL